MASIAKRIRRTLERRARFERGRAQKGRYRRLAVDECAAIDPMLLALATQTKEPAP